MDLKRLSSLLFFLALQLIAFSQSYAPELGEDKMVVKPKVPLQAFAFSLKDVQLKESIFKEAMAADVRWLRSLDPDRFLSQFRSHSGMKPKAKKYGGWESEGLAGHSLGHYLSAISMHYAVSGDTSFLNKINYVVNELALIQHERATGYVGAIPDEDSVFYLVSLGKIRSHGFDLNGAWAPWYTIHKIMAGLLDAYLYADSQKALEINLGIADWASDVLRGLTYEEIQKMLRCEYGGMNEVLANTYALTGNKKYLDLSYKFHDNFLLDSLQVKVNALPGKHFNTQVPKVIGAVRRYELTGNIDDLTIGEFFWQTIVNHHTYAPGGNSNYEYLGPNGQLNDRLTDNTMETCNTHNMLKLTRHLFGLGPSARLMDYYERALYNHILASQDRSDGMMCYFVPLRMGTRKEFSDPEHSFTCCVGTGMENHVKYGESIYYQGADKSLFVNLFIPSVLDWKDQHTTVTIDADIPVSNKVRITISPEKAADFVVRVRKPEWVNSDIAFKVNDKSVTAVPGDNGYYQIDRKWKKNDVVTFELPMDLHARTMPDNENRMAFFYGPVMLAGDMGKEEPDPSVGVPVFISDLEDVNQMIRPVSPGVFASRKVGQPVDVTFRPFYTFSDSFYSVYWDVFDSSEWKQQRLLYEKLKREKAAVESRTLDILRLGEMQPERDHNLVGKETHTGESHTRKWRSTTGGGYYEFDMKVSPELENELLMTYWGMDNRGRRFEIYVDGEKIADVDLDRYKDSRFYDINYLIPSQLTKEKNQVKVKVMAKPGNQAGPVYGVRMVKTE